MAKPEKLITSQCSLFLSRAVCEEKILGEIEAGVSIYIMVWG